MVVAEVSINGVSSTDKLLKVCSGCSAVKAFNCCSGCGGATVVNCCSGCGGATAVNCCSCSGATVSVGCDTGVVKNDVLFAVSKSALLKKLLLYAGSAKTLPLAPPLCSVFKNPLTVLIPSELYKFTNFPLSGFKI